MSSVYGDFENALIYNREDQKWYYKSLAEVFSGRGESESFKKLAAEFKNVVDELFSE